MHNELIKTGIISTISALVVFFLSEKIKSNRNDRVLFKKLEFQLYETLILLYRLKSSCNQFIDILDKYTLKEVGSIGFPIYSFQYFREIIPVKLYNSKNGNLFLSLLNIHKIIFSLNDSLNNLLINNIQADLLGKRVSLEDSEIRYHQEVNYVNLIFNALPQYINLVKRTLAEIMLINNYKNIRNYLFIKIHFLDKEINSQIKIIEKEVISKYNKIEDINVS